jgi:hypothetical protein
MWHGILGNGEENMCDLRKLMFFDARTGMSRTVKYKEI